MPSDETKMQFDQVQVAAETEEYLTKRRKELTDQIWSVSSCLRRRKELTDQIKLIDAKIQWMKETGATEYDETEHKVWSVLNAVENDSLSKMERVRIIASLIKA